MPVCTFWPRTLYTRTDHAHCIIIIMYTQVGRYTRYNNITVRCYAVYTYAVAAAILLLLLISNGVSDVAKRLINNGLPLASTV